MYNLTKYNYPLLLESLCTLKKWHKTINTQPYTQWKKHLDSTHNKHPKPISQQELTKLTAHINAIVRNYPTEFNCMRRSLALKSMIEKRQGQCKLHIGVKFESTKQSTTTMPTVAAHAWISVNNTLINDTPQKIAEYKEITHDNMLFSTAKITD